METDKTMLKQILDAVQRLSNEVAGLRQHVALHCCGGDCPLAGTHPAQQATGSTPPPKQSPKPDLLSSLATWSISDSEDHPASPHPSASSSFSSAQSSTSKSSVDSKQNLLAQSVSSAPTTSGLISGAVEDRRPPFIVPPPLWKLSAAQLEPTAHQRCFHSRRLYDPLRIVMGAYPKSHDDLKRSIIVRAFLDHAVCRVSGQYSSSPLFIIPDLRRDRLDDPFRPNMLSIMHRYIKDRVGRASSAYVEIFKPKHEVEETVLLEALFKEFALVIEYWLILHHSDLGINPDGEPFSYSGAFTKFQREFTSIMTGQNYRAAIHMVKELLILPSPCSETDSLDTTSVTVEDPDLFEPADSKADSPSGSMPDGDSSTQDNGRSDASAGETTSKDSESRPPVSVLQEKPASLTIEVDNRSSSPEEQGLPSVRDGDVFTAVLGSTPSEEEEEEETPMEVDEVQQPQLTVSIPPKLGNGVKEETSEPMNGVIFESEPMAGLESGLPQSTTVKQGNNDVEMKEAPQQASSVTPTPQQAEPEIMDGVQAETVNAVSSQLPFIPTLPPTPLPPPPSFGTGLLTEATFTATDPRDRPNDSTDQVQETISSMVAQTESELSNPQQPNVEPPCKPLMLNYLQTQVRDYHRSRICKILHYLNKDIIQASRYHAMIKVVDEVMLHDLAVVVEDFTFTSSGLNHHTTTVYEQTAAELVTRIERWYFQETIPPAGVAYLEPFVEKVMLKRAWDERQYHYKQEPFLAQIQAQPRITSEMCSIPIDYRLLHARRFHHRITLTTECFLRRADKVAFSEEEIHHEALDLEHTCATESKACLYSYMQLVAGKMNAVSRMAYVESRIDKLRASQGMSIDSATASTQPTPAETSNSSAPLIDTLRGPAFAPTPTPTPRPSTTRTTTPSSSQPPRPRGGFLQSLLNDIESSAQPAAPRRPQPQVPRSNSTRSAPAHTTTPPQVNVHKRETAKDDDEDDSEPLKGGPRKRERA